MIIAYFGGCRLIHALVITVITFLSIFQSFNKLQSFYLDTLTEDNNDMLVSSTLI